MTRPIHPTLLIGLGGTGRHALTAIKQKMYEQYVHPHYPLTSVRLLAVDTELGTGSEPVRVRSRRLAAGGAENPTYAVRLSPTECFPIEVEKTNLRNAFLHPETYGAADFIEPAYLGDVVDSIEGQGAGGFAIAGKMALWRRLESFQERLETELRTLNTTGELRKNLSHYDGDYELDSEHSLTVMIFCSLGGGTGRGIFLTVATLVRELLNKLDPKLAESAQIMLFNYGPTCFQLAGRDVGTNYFKTIRRNQASGVVELEHALRHGYPLEDKLCQLLGYPAPRTAPQIFTDVFQLSGQRSGSGAFVGNFAALNDTVAGVITDLLFGNMMTDLRAYFRSNKGSFIQNNPITEAHGLPVKRRRDYGRIGRQKLVLPLDRLLRYAEHHHAEGQIDRMLTGTEEIDTPQRERTQATLFATFDEGTQGLIGHYRIPTYEQLQEQLVLFSDPVMENLSQTIRGTASNLEGHFRTQGVRRSRLRVDLDRRLDVLFDGTDERTPGWNRTLDHYAEQYGLRALRRLLDNARAQLDERYFSEFAEEMQELGLLPATEDWLAQLTGYLKTQLEQRATEFEPFVTGTAAEFQTLQRALDTDRQTWEKRNRGLWAKLRGPEPQELRTARSPLKMLVGAAGATFGRYRTTAGRFARLSALTHLRQRLDALAKTLAQNLLVLEAATDGLLTHHRTVQRDILRERDSELVLSVIERGAVEFSAFADALRDATNRPLRDRFTEQLRPLRRMLTHEAVSSTKLAEQLKRVTTAVYERRERHTLVGYFEQMERTGAGERMRDLLQQVLRSADLLGTLSGTNAYGGLDRGGFSLVRIRANRPQWWQRMYPDLTDDFTFSEATDPLELTVTRLETALPLFLFREFVDAQRDYEEVLAAGELDAHVLHTHCDFVRLSPPMGLPEEFAAEELRLFYHMLLHLDLVRVREGVVELQRHPRRMDGQWTPLVDDRLDPYLHTDAQRRVPLDRFLAELNHRRAWFGRFVQLLRRGLNHLTEHRPGELLHYLTGHERAYPCLPPVVVAHLIAAQPDGQLAQTLTRYTEANRRRYEGLRVLPQLSAKQRPPVERAELTDWYDLPAPPPAPGKKPTRYRVLTTHAKKATERLPLDEVVRLIRRNPNVLVSTRKKPRANGWLDWRRVPELVAAVGRLRTTK